MRFDISRKTRPLTSMSIHNNYINDTIFTYIFNSRHIVHWKRGSIVDAVGVLLARRWRYVIQQTLTIDATLGLTIDQFVSLYSDP